MADSGICSVLAFMLLWINDSVARYQQGVIADLEALPATALQKVADFVHQMRDTAAAETAGIHSSTSRSAILMQRITASERARYRRWLGGFHPRLGH